MRVAVSFTGGKDSVLASHLVLNAGLRAAARWDDRVVQHWLSPDDGTDGAPTPTPTPTPTLALLPPTVDIVVLVTFAPPADAHDDEDNERGFKAHPLRLVRAQAAALAAGIAAAKTTPPPSPPPFVILDIVPPHADSYAAQLARLREEYRVDALVTGDVLDVCSGFMAKTCARAGLRLVTPLWQQPRERILGALEALGIRAIVTCVDVRKFAPPPPPSGAAAGDGQDGGARSLSPADDPVASLLGRELTRALWDGPGTFLRRFRTVDLCGEGGEYHTAVFEAPRLFLPRAMTVEVVGHALNGGAHAHVRLGRVCASAGSGADLSTRDA